MINVIKTTRMVTLFLLAFNIYAAPTELGNGNDGKDLVEFVEVKEGIILDSRKEAVEFLSKINLRGIQGLGYLKDEVEKSRLYIAKDGLTPQELLDLGAFKTGNNPVVYARTFPRPHAPTRFFPAARELSKKRLISLHIHEGLHRALPEGLREDEEVVEKITRVITSPDSTFEDIVAVMDKNLPMSKGVVIEVTKGMSEVVTEKKIRQFFTDNRFSYEVNNFSDPNLLLWNHVKKFSAESIIYKWKNWSIQFKTDLYSFDNVLGAPTDNVLNLSLRLEEKMNEHQAWGVQVSATGVSSEVTYNNPLNRQVWTAQLDYMKSYDSFNLITKVYYTPGGYANGNLEFIQNPNIIYDQYDYSNQYKLEDRDIIQADSNFGDIFSLGVEAKKQWNRKWAASLSLDVHKMEGYSSTTDERVSDPDARFGFRELNSGSLDTSLPVLAVLSAGSSYKAGDFSLAVKYFYLVNRPENEEIGAINLTTLADPIGRGLGNSSLSVSAAYQF